MHVALLVPILLATIAAVNDQDQREHARTLIARAATQLSWKKFDQPYRLVAQVRLHGLRQGPVDGSYEITFQSPNSWREDIRVPGYEEITITVQNKSYTKRSVDYRPLRIHELRELLSMAILFDTQDLKVGKVRKRETSSDRLLCVEIERTAFLLNALACFDSDSGDLRSYDARLHNVPDNYEFRDYAEQSGMRLPRSWKLKIEKEVLVEVTNLEITPSNPSAGAFDVPIGSEVFDGCARRPSQRSSFQWSKLIPLQSRSWRVVVYYVAEKDGSLTNVKLLETNWPQIGELFVTNLRSQRLHVTCADQPMRIEGVVHFAAESGR